MRTEKDLLGEKLIPKQMLWGIHTARALENFPISKRRVPGELIQAYGSVKWACAKVNQRLGFLPEPLALAIQNASLEMAEGALDDWVVVDAYQGGAGTSTHFNVCEVIANRALQLMGHQPGDYAFCDPLLHVNLHQSTNDTYPTSLRVAVLRLLKKLEDAIVRFQEICQSQERRWAHVIKVGRTELMDAVPMTLGRTFGAWAEVLSRDRWRIFKCTERIRVVNLGGTAIGTGIGAPREFIFQAVDELRVSTGLPLSRGENLVDQTQNLDALVETMGMLKTHAMNLLKISGDLRLLAMGPDAGLSEIKLPALQAGSSIMPNKINPVVPEMMAQVAMQVSGYDQIIGWAAGSGQLELNAFLPLIALNLLESLTLLTAADQVSAERCLDGLEPNAARCAFAAYQSSALATALIPYLGYYQAAEVSQYMQANKPCTVQEAARAVAGVSSEMLEEIFSPEALNALGYRGGKHPS